MTLATMASKCHQHML